MVHKESITAQWKPFTRKLKVELEKFNCVPFDVFYHSNTKFLKYTNVDFWVWVPLHASSQLNPDLTKSLLKYQNNQIANKKILISDLRKK